MGQIKVVLIFNEDDECLQECQYLKTKFKMYRSTAEHRISLFGGIFMLFCYSGI